MATPCTKCVFSLEEDDSFKTEEFSSLLIQAMRNDHKQCVNAWIKSGADVNIADEYGTTTLFIAIWKEDLITVIKLIEAGADVNIANDAGTSPLRVAVLGGLDTCLDVLVKAGADVNEDGKLTTALIDAVRQKNINCLTILLEAGADVNKTDSEGASTLHYAAFNADSKYTELLLNAGADVNIVDSYSNTALTRASRCGDHHSVELLIKAGADVNSKND